MPAPTSATAPLSPDRSAALAAALEPGRLPTPPAVALQVVSAASNPDCKPSEIVALLSLDPALCAKLLRAVNSCVYGLSRPVASLDRAVAVLGLGAVRSLALGLSLPAVKTGPADEETRAYYVSSVGGAIIARDLAARTRRPQPSDDLVAGLLRDLGAILLKKTCPDAWRDMTARWGDRLITEQCEVEEEVFGVSHAEVSAELLRGWNLPADIVEPIRLHHRPGRAGPDRVVGERAELLHFADLLANLDVVVRRPDVLEYVLSVARNRYDLPQPELVGLLEGVAPKVAEFGRLLRQDIGQCPDFAAILSAGAAELVNLTVETSRSRLSGGVAHPTPRPSASLVATMVTTPALGALRPGAAPARPPAGDLPEFRPAFIEEFPNGGCRLGEYELRGQLGRGAMGVVFKAFEPSLARFVAVKLLAPQLATDATARLRFAREARVAAAVQHENVVAVYAVREAGGLSYLAMEFVKGEPLDKYILENQPLPIPAVVRIARQIAAGLAAAHEKGIVHRDVKPANILLGSATGRVKLTDFGLARAGDDARLSLDGTLIGTPGFMSPEQVQGRPATPLSDLFSLGAVIYALCTADPPFPGSNLAAVLHAVAEAEPVPLRRVRPDVPAWLAEVVLRLMRKDPAERFRSADEVVARLVSKSD